MACWTVVIFSASSSGISVSNSSSRAITSSTVSSESAPRSSTNEDSFLISASFTPSCSATIFLTRCSTLSMRTPSLCPLLCVLGVVVGLRRGEILSEAPTARCRHDWVSVHVHAAVHRQRRAGDVGGGRRCEEAHCSRDVLGQSEPAERDLPEQRLAL